MRRKALSEVSLEERAITREQHNKEMLARQYTTRMNAVQGKIRALWLSIIKEHTSPKALWISKNIPPSWYIKSMYFVLMSLPNMFRVFLVNHSVPNILVSIVCLPISLSTLMLSLLFLRPFIMFRGYMGHFGLQLRINKIDKFAVQHVVYKWGKVISEEKWEI
jgi:hypothetical protein